MYDYEQIEDSLRFCDRKIYLSHIDDHNTKKYSESEKKKWEDIANDILKEKNTQNETESVEDEVSYIQDAADYRKRADEYVPFYKRTICNLFVLVFCIVIAFGVAGLITNYVAFQSTVEGISMQPVLENNDSIIIDKFSYKIDSPKRYDIVVFPIEDTDADGKKRYFIKRIIGLPGETVYIDDGSVYINGSLLKSEKYGKELMKEAGTASEPQTLASDEYFVLGDNRNMSTDSRSETVGLVRKEDITGKAVFRIWPFKKFGGLN